MRELLLVQAASFFSSNFSHQSEKRRLRSLSTPKMVQRSIWKRYARKFAASASERLQCSEMFSENGEKNTDLTQ